MTAPLTRFGFLTLRHFSMIAFTNAIEPLRMKDGRMLAPETPGMGSELRRDWIAKYKT